MISEAGDGNAEEKPAKQVELEALLAAPEGFGDDVPSIPILTPAVAQFERSLIVERVRAGLLHARAQGRRLGRPPLRLLTPEEVTKLRRERIRTKAPFRKLATKYGISVFTAHKLCVHNGRMRFSNLAAD